MKNPDRPRGGGAMRKLFGKLAPAALAIMASCGGDSRAVLEPNEDPTEDADAGVAGADAGTEGESESESEGETPAPPDADGDGIPDDGKSCPLTPDMIDPRTGEPVDTDGDGITNACDPCPQNPNGGKADDDGDGIGDACDLARNAFDPTNRDGDHDLVGDIVDNCGEPNPLQTDDDDDGVGPPCDMDDHDATVYPGAPDAPCDGTDSNGDGAGRTLATNADGTVTIQGEPDCECIPGATRTIGTGVGPCVPVEEECQYTADGEGSEFVQTNPGEDAGPVSEGTVCDGVDNSCNGITDEGLTCPDCTEGAERPCGVTDVGPCSMGVQRCVGGTWGTTCEGEVPPADSDDPCDDTDNDCNGTVDPLRIDPETGLSRTCTGTAPGECRTRTGELECNASGRVQCNVDPGGTAYVGQGDPCNGRNDDCDTETDEDPQTVVGGMIPGETGVAGTACELPGECGPGVFACNGPRAVQCTSAASRVGVPTADEIVCDGRDRNCNGSAGEGCDCKSGDRRACGEDEGACEPGEQVCDDAGEWQECVPEQAPVREDCSTPADGLDGDCDRETDEPRGNACGPILNAEGDVVDGVVVCNPDTGLPFCAED